MYLVCLVLQTLICSTPLFLWVIVIIVPSFLPSTSLTQLTTVDSHPHPHLMGSVQHNIGITIEVVKGRTEGFIVGLNIVGWNGQSCVYLRALVLNFLIQKFIWEYVDEQEAPDYSANNLYLLLNQWMVHTVQTLCILQNFNLCSFRHASFLLK